jgi:ankyrin repeat protein
MKKNSKKKVKMKRETNDGINVMEMISKNDIKGIIKNLEFIPLDKPIHYDLYLIHYAVMLNNLELLQAILKKNDKWDYKERNGISIAHMAAYQGYCEILEFLAKKYKNKILEIKNNKNENILFSLIENPQCFDNIKNLDIKKYINEINNIGDTPLTHVFGLLSNLIDVKINRTTNNKYRQIEPKEIIKKYDSNHPFFKSIFKILEYGGNPDIKVALPPIVIAASYNALDLVEILIKYKCDVNIGDKAGKTALGWAIYNNNLEMMKKLIKNGAEIDIYTVLGDSYLPLVGINFANDDIIKYILEQKINYEFTDYSHNTMAHIILLNYTEYPLNIIKTIMKNTKNYNKTNLDGNSLGHLICTLSNELLENVKIEIVNSLGQQVFLDNVNILEPSVPFKLSLNNKISEGVYILKIYNDHFQYAKKFKN